MSALSAGFAGLWGRWQVKLAIAGFLLALGFIGGWKVESVRWDAAEAATEKAVIDQLIRGAKVNEKLTVRYVTNTKIIHDRIAQEPTYVTPEADAACDLSPDLIRMWNDTNANTDPAAGNAAHPADAAGDAAPSAGGT